MAQHNPQSRAYLVIVMVAIVVCFVSALFILGHVGGGDKPTANDHDNVPKTQAAGAAHQDSVAAQEKPDRSPREDARGDAAMTDDVSPPDEMVNEPMVDGTRAPNP